MDNSALNGGSRKSVKDRSATRFSKLADDIARETFVRSAFSVPWSSGL